jgi:hypothetical protein
LIDGLILPDDPIQQIGMQPHCFVPRLRRVESFAHPDHGGLSSHFTYRAFSGEFDQYSARLLPFV